MRKNYLRSFLFSCVLAAGTVSTSAQEIVNSVQQKVAGRNGNPSLVVFTKSSNYSLNQSQLVLKQQLNLGQNDAFKKLSSETDRLGYTHEKHQQLYNGVKVEFGNYTLHAKKGKIVSMSGEFYDTKNVNVVPKLSKAQGLQNAMNNLKAKSYLWEDPAASKELGYQKPKGELVLLPIYDNQVKRGETIEKLRLAYKYDIFTIQPLGGADIYVDAVTGDVLFQNARVKHVDNFGHDGRDYAGNSTAISKEAVVKAFAPAMVSGVADTRYSGTQTIETTLSGSNYTLNDASRKVYTRNANNMAPGTTSLPYITNYSEFTDNDNNWTAAEFDNVDKDNAALDAHWGAMMTYDYWLNVHGRSSYDNAGSQLRSYVHVDNNYDNAFWYLNVMSYGDGSSDGTEGNGYFDALTSIDVAAHEIGHGVCEYTANLAYQKESGAMNEAFSDIWGAAIEHYAKGNGSDTNPDASVWLIGDEIDRRTGSAALRSMSNPTSLGQPDTYGGTYWVSVNCTPASSNDYCGVHTNSGVLNYWFYLLTVGGSGTNDIGSGYNVSGIGMAKAANIAYRLESVYLSSNSTYADARASGIQAAKDLYGTGSAEEIAVTNAFYAVGVGNAYGDNSVNYCASASSNVNDEYIGRVQLNTIDNASGGQFYSNFKAISTDLSKDTQYTITITPTWTGTVYSEGYAVWIDYNQNGDFTDAGELVYSRAATTSTPISGSFTIPATATDGATRMRVSMKYNGIPTSCESFTYGEVEDYTVNIGGSSSGGDTEAPTAPTSLTASSVTETTATLSWTASTDNVGVTGYNVYQGSTNIGTVTGTSANITGLVANTAYSFSVTAVDAAANESAASNTVTFTTPSGADTEAPTAPSSLTSSNVTQTTVDLSWTASTDNVGVTGYDVYQDGSYATTVTGTSTTISGLSAGTSYAFYVIAKDAAGNSSTASNTVNVTTQASGGGSSLTIFDGSFETGWEGWIDGGGDVSRYSGSRSYDGNYSILIRDNSGGASAMTLGSFDVTSYDNIEIVFYFYPLSMETGEDFWVRYYDGSSWNTVAAYASGSSFTNGSFYVATVNIPASSYNFPSNAQFAFQCDASSNADYIYIDKVTITATSGAAAFDKNSIVGVGGGMNGFATEPSDLQEIDGLEISPNPASIEATVRVALDIEDSIGEDVQMNIFDIQGKLVKSQSWEHVTESFFEKSIDISQLQQGVYFMNISTSKGFIETQKLIVK